MYNGPLAFTKLQALMSAPKLHVACFSRSATHIVDNFVFYQDALQTCVVSSMGKKGSHCHINKQNN